MYLFNYHTYTDANIHRFSIKRPDCKIALGFHFFIEKKYSSRPFFRTEKPARLGLGEKVSLLTRECSPNSNFQFIKKFI